MGEFTLCKLDQRGSFITCGALVFEESPPSYFLPRINITKLLITPTKKIAIIWTALDWW